MFSIVKITFLYFWRHNIVRLILGFSVFFLFGSWFVGQLALEEQSKIIIDFSLGIIEVFALLLTLFFGSTLLFQEKKQKTVQLILLKNNRIGNFIVAKFLGFSLVLLLFFFIFLISYLFLSLFANLFVSELWIWSLVSIFFVYIKILVVLAFVMFFSTFVSPILTLISSFVIYLVSHITGFLFYYVHHGQINVGILQKYIIDFLYYVLPNFEKISVNEHIFSYVFSSFSFGFFVQIIVVQFVYIFLLLFFAILIYSFDIFKNS